LYIKVRFPQPGSTKMLLEKADPKDSTLDTSLSYSFVLQDLRRHHALDADFARAPEPANFRWDARLYQGGPIKEDTTPKKTNQQDARESDSNDNWMTVGLVNVSSDQ
jgi:hypothetical protein